MIRTILFAAIFVGSCLIMPLGSIALAQQDNMGIADTQFKAGKFVEAEKLYAQVLDKDPKNFRALVKMGYLALLSNRLDEAQNWLTKALELKPGDSSPTSLLAEAFYRRDDFQKAAPLFRAIGQEAKAKQLESFKTGALYRIEGQAQVTSLKFVMTDPLPVVQVRVNSKEPVNFFIDTGGAEIILDPDFAQEVGVSKFGSETGSFGGGKKAAFEFGRVDAVTLGEFTVKNVPVHLLAVRRFSQPVFGGKPVDGIIGTILLYHFLGTLDYPQGELVLRRKTSASQSDFAKEAEQGRFISVPFWLAGDHYMVAWGAANKSGPMLFFVDTGLAGGGFMSPESTLKKADIKLLESQASEGVGGGGKFRTVPFVVDELTFGEAREKNVPGSFSGPFRLEDSFGFHIGGLISHAFFRPYAVTFDFNGMRILLKRKA